MTHLSRRHLIALSAAFAATPAFAAYDASVYQPGLLTELRKSGKVFVFNFGASWSLTSQIKRDAIAELKQANPDYLANITFVDIDWDTYGPSQMAERLKVKRHSTLLALKGKSELGRLEGEIEMRQIKAFLDDTLQAARA